MIAAAPVTELHLNGPFEESCQRLPGIRFSQGLICQCGYVRKTLLKRADHLLFLRIVAIGSTDPDASVVRDVVKGHVQAALREEFAGSRQQTLTVHGGILSSVGWAVVAMLSV